MVLSVHHSSVLRAEGQHLSLQRIESTAVDSDGSVALVSIIGDTIFRASLPHEALVVTYDIPNQPLLASWYRYIVLTVP